LIVEYLLTGATIRPPPRAVVPEDELRRWAGTYHIASPRHQLLAFLERMLPGLELYVDGGRLYARQVPGSGALVELVPVGGDRFRLPGDCGSRIRFGRDRDGRRIFVASGAYFVEEPRARSVAYCLAPVVCLWLLFTGLLFLLGAFRRRAGPTPGAAWPLC